MRTTLIAISLAANVAIGIAAYSRLAAKRPASKVLTAIVVKRDATAKPALDLTTRWHEINRISDDTKLVAQLRAEGFPPAVIHALISERIEERYTSRLRAIRQKSPKKPYWQTSGWYDSILDLAARAEVRAIYREQRDAVRALLGDDGEFLDDYQRAQRARSYGTIPAAKISALENILRDYSEITRQVREGNQGITLAADREKLALIENEKRTDLVQLLSPAELEEYDRRNSPAASEIRSKLRYFDASEQDFLALYQIQRDFDIRYGRDNLSGEQSDRRKAALSELAAQIKTALGPDRYVTYEIVTDGNYFATRSLMTDLGLPPESANALVAIQRNTNSAAESILTDQSLSAEQRTAQLASLEKAATEKVTAALGTTENFASFKRYSAGQWLNRLNPPARPAGRP
jgi:hypothetical protein